MTKDFSLKKYFQIIDSLVSGNYSFITIQAAIDSRNYSQKYCAIIRHDIDTKFDLPLALKMAEYEAKNEIVASYYFRTIPETFNEDVISRIADLGHEIGYHYEVMALCNGDESKAIDRLKSDLITLRNIYPVKTICQHGGAMGYYNTTSVRGLSKIGLDYLRGKIQKIEYYPSILLWDKYHFKDFDLLGDAYLSLDFSEIKYFSDTGQRWDSFGTRILDNIEEAEALKKYTARSSNELIKLIESGQITKLNLLVHPANWHDNFYDWLKWRTLQKIRNTLKKIYKPKVNR